jgi:hypothetical protein
LRRTVNPALLLYLSPIGWENVVLYGEYHLDRDLVHQPHMELGVEN